MEQICSEISPSFWANSVAHTEKVEAADRHRAELAEKVLILANDKLEITMGDDEEEEEDEEERPPTPFAMILDTGEVEAIKAACQRGFVTITKHLENGPRKRTSTTARKTYIEL